MDSICDCVAGWESFVDCYGKLCGIIVIKRNGRSVRNKKIFIIRKLLIKQSNLKIIQNGIIGKKIVLVTEMVFYSLLYIDFECIDDVNCNLHGTCNKETGQCVCDIGWDSELDCSGTHL